MSYVAEPYAQFVDDLLTGLTGGVVREEFRYLAENEPFRLSAPFPLIRSTVRVTGQADGAFQRFRAGTDFDLGEDNAILWRRQPNGSPAADATLPDPGSAFYANFEIAAPGGAAPLLTDRNPGSVVRLLAESFGREYAVLSRQLEAVYEAAFVDTATGRDLDQLVRLLGLSRLQATSATGTVLFARTSPAPADIFIPAGTRVSTAEPPPVVFETTEDRTLRAGNLGVEAPVAALVADAAGVVAAGVITAIHRPILGIESVSNPQATRFAGTVESDEALRARARRALERAGQATTGALLGALTSLAGVREKDVRIAEDPIAHPGVVRLDVALPAMPDEECQRAAERAVALVEEVRPVGVRILHNIDAPRPLGPGTPSPNPVPDEGDAPASIGVTSELFLPVAIDLEVMPTTLALTPAERSDLATRAERTARAFLDEAGIGEVLVYNRLVANLMALDGVLDVAVEIYPQSAPELPHRKNLIPDDPGVRPVAGQITVEVGGSLVMLDVTVGISLKGAGLIGEASTNKAAARSEIESRLRTGLERRDFTTLSVTALMALIGQPETYSVTDLHYTVEYVDAGVRIHQQDVGLPLGGLERVWVRKVSLAGEEGEGGAS